MRKESKPSQGNGGRAPKPPKKRKNSNEAKDIRKKGGAKSEPKRKPSSLGAEEEASRWPGNVERPDITLNLRGWSIEGGKRRKTEENKMEEERGNFGLSVASESHLDGLNREYLKEAVIPSVRAGIEKLTHQLVQERIRVLEGQDWDEGYLPKHWENVCPVEWLGKYLLEESRKNGELQSDSAA